MDHDKEQRRSERLARLLPRLRMVDIEASDGGPDAWPIEIGWARFRSDGEVETFSSLIRPDPAWPEIWSPYAERVHGIARDQLATAPTARSVAHKLIAALGQPELVLVSDSPRNDQAWLDRLLSAAGRPAGTFEIVAPGEALKTLVKPEQVRAIKDWLRENKGPHRAGGDAARLARAIHYGAIECEAAGLSQSAAIPVYLENEAIPCPAPEP